MTSVEDRVTAHYGSSAIVQRILDAVALAGHDPSRLTPELLFPYDQLHGREIIATREHVAWLNLSPNMHVVDIGSGLGGPARFVAASTGASVLGIDLTEQFVHAARELTERCGLSGLVSFQHGNAVSTTLPGDEFDAALCLHVGMNIEDKPALFSEIFRLLKPSGRLCLSQVVRGDVGEPSYPLPWAVDEGTSFIGTREQLCNGLEDAGFVIEEVRDETGLHLDFARNAQAAAANPNAAHAVANQVVLGEGFVERRRNYLAGITSGALRSLAILARK